MSARSRQSLRGLTLAVLIPCLLFSAILSGWITYRDLYRVILDDGFQQKLDAVSTGVAAFIDANDYRELSRATTLQGIAAQPDQTVLWGLDPAQGQLVSVDMVAGRASPLMRLPVRDVRGLVYDAALNRLLTMEPSSGDLIAFVADSSSFQHIATVQPGGHALALDSTGTHLVVAGPRGLQGYDLAPSSQPLVPTWTRPVPARAIAVSPRTGALYVLDNDGNLLTADSLGGPLRTLGPIAAADEEGDPSELSEVSALTISPRAAVIFAAGKRLLAISPDDLTFEGEKFRRGYRNGTSPLYNEYVEPMRRIRADLDLTYLYTENLVPGDSIQYILDSTPLGPDYSPIGTRETLETEADIRGLADLMERGLVYSSAIEDSEDWGLLKSTFAPILSQRNDPVGIVGTDISVATIRDRTQLALAKVGLVTVVVLFLGGLLSVAISLRLTGPLAAVKEGATRVAAGQAGAPIEPPRLRDLAALTMSFNEMTRTLTSSVNELRDETFRVASMRTRRYLVQELTSRVAMAERLPEGLSVTWSGQPTGDPVDAGYVVVGEAGRPLTVAWAASGAGDPLDTLADREEFSVLARRLSESGVQSADELAVALGKLGDVGEGTFVVVDSVEHRVHAAPGSRLHGVLATTSGAEDQVDLEGGAAFQVPEGSELTFSVIANGHAPDGADAPGWVIRVRGRRS